MAPARVFGEKMRKGIGRARKLKFPRAPPPFFQNRMPAYSAVSPRSMRSHALKKSGFVTVVLCFPCALVCFKFFGLCEVNFQRGLCGLPLSLKEGVAEIEIV